MLNPHRLQYFLPIDPVKILLPLVSTQVEIFVKSGCVWEFDLMSLASAGPRRVACVIGSWHQEFSMTKMSVM